MNNRFIKHTKGILFGSLFVILLGCSSSSPMVQPQKLAASNPPPFKPFLAMPVPAEGSLWTDNGELLFVDNKARRVGDTITIDIVENASSELNANTKADRSSSLEANIEEFSGYIRYLEEKNRRFKRDKDGNLVDSLFKGSLESKFKGDAKTDRDGRVTASISGRVIEVLPNGNLVIQGRREMKVNFEVQVITVTGIVRPKDIDVDNRVKSTFLADARVEYFGKGVLADKQKPGWGTQVLDKIWPF